MQANTAVLPNSHPDLWCSAAVREAVVLMVTVAVAVVTPAAGITEAGATLQVPSVMLAGTTQVKVAP